MATIEAEPQWQAALHQANRARLDATAVRNMVSDGTMTLAAAIENPAAAPLTVFALLKAQYGWGAGRATRALAAAGVSERKLVRELTARQRALIVEQCASLPRECGGRRSRPDDAA